MRWGDLKDKFSGHPDNIEVLIVVDGVARADVRTRRHEDHLRVVIGADLPPPLVAVEGETAAVEGADASKKRKKAAE